MASEAVFTVAQGNREKRFRKPHYMLRIIRVIIRKKGIREKQISPSLPWDGKWYLFSLYFGEMLFNLCCYSFLCLFCYWCCLERCWGHLYTHHSQSQKFSVQYNAAISITNVRNKLLGSSNKLILQSKIIFIALIGTCIHSIWHSWT